MKIFTGHLPLQKIKKIIWIITVIVIGWNVLIQKNWTGCISKSEGMKK